MLQRQVVRFPCHGAVADSPWVSFCRPLRFTSCSTLTVCSMSLLRRSSRFVRSRGKQSRSHSCSLFLLDKLLLARCVQRQVPMLIALQFIDSCERPCDHTATVASDSVHRQSRGQTSCATGHGTRLSAVVVYVAMSGVFDAFCVIFRAPPAMPELSASFFELSSAHSCECSRAPRGCRSRRESDLAPGLPINSPGCGHTHSV